MAVGDTRDMADLILIAVSLALAAYYVIKLYKLPAAQRAKRRIPR